MEELNRKLLESNLPIILGLEYLGIRFEDTKEEKSKYGLFSKTAYYYSVPESSILEVENKDLNERIKTAHDLKYLAKESLIDMMIDNLQEEFDEDDELVSEIKNNMNDYCKFYAKVRSGEVWNEELAKQRIEDLTKELKEASGYKEI
jgi:hypothetical protein